MSSSSSSSISSKDINFDFSLAVSGDCSLNSTSSSTFIPSDEVITLVPTPTPIFPDPSLPPPPPPPPLPESPMPMPGSGSGFGSHEPYFNVSPTLADTPSLVLFKLFREYLPFHAMRTLRCVCRRLRAHVDEIVYFRVPLNNTSLKWVKKFVSPINSLTLGVLTTGEFREWSKEEHEFPEIQELFANNSQVDEANVQKLFEIFPNICNLTLKNLSLKELTQLLELKIKGSGGGLSQVRDKSFKSVAEAVEPKWNALTSLEFFVNKVPEGLASAFSLLARRHYAHLSTLTLDLRLQGHFKGNYGELHPLYVNWVEFIANHSKTLKSLSFKHDLGLDLDTQFVLEHPFDDLGGDRDRDLHNHSHIRDTDTDADDDDGLLIDVDAKDITVTVTPPQATSAPETTTNTNQTSRSRRITKALGGMILENLELKPHFHESKLNSSWNWSWKILETQSHLCKLSLDFTDNPHGRDPEDIRQIVAFIKGTLREFEYTSSSDKSLGLPLALPELDNDNANANANPNPNLRGITFDLAMFRRCEALKSLDISRGWSRQNIEWGPTIFFSNVETLPINLKVVKLRTENGRFSEQDALWISRELPFLEDLVLPTCMNRRLVTNLLGQPSLSKFTLVRDYFSEIKIREMVHFCERTEGMSYYCPEIQCYDPSGRWLELLIITVMVDRKRFSLSPQLGEQFPGVLVQNYT